MKQSAIFIMQVIAVARAVNMTQWRIAMKEASFAVNVRDEPSQVLLPLSNKLRGGTVKSSYIETNPETGEIIMRPSGSKAILDGIQMVTGLEFEAVRLYDTWGDVQNMNNSQTGGLMRGEIDIGLNIYAHCCDRYLVHDFASIVEVRQFVVLFRQPDLAQDIFINQFDLNLWIHLVLFILILVVLMQLMQWVEKKYHSWEHIEVGVNEKRDITFSSMDTLSWAFCFVSQQGHDVEPASVSMKLTFFMGFFMGLITFTGFSANIVTTLTSVKSIETFQDLVNYDDITILGSAFRPWQQEVRDSAQLKGKEDVKKLVERMDEAQDQAKCQSGPLKEHSDGHPVIDCDTAKVRALASKTLPEIATVNPSFWTWRPDANEFNTDRALACELSHFTLPIGDQLSSFGLRRGLPQAHLINKGILRLRETGVLQKIWDKYGDHQPACADFNAVQYKQVSFRHVFGAYILLGCGYGISGLIALLEIFTGRLFFSGQDHNKQNMP